MTRAHYGVTTDGTPVEAYLLANRAEMQVRILTLGCIVARLEVPDREGKPANVVLGLESVADYSHRSSHFGAIAGRFANRIACGRFAIDGKEYRLQTNDGANTLHSGRHGFDKMVWQAESATGTELVLHYFSPDGEAGFPGNLAVTVTYSLGAANDLRIDCQAATDQPTIVNLTNHSYFNLAGEGSGDVLGHIVAIEADHFTPVDAGQIPTGEIRAVAGTPFDFTTPRPIGERVRETDEQLLIARGYDHNWVLRATAEGGVRPAARAFEPGSGRVLDVLTDAPGLQFYTGNSLNGVLAGPARRAYRQSDGFCFETKTYPDAPNQPYFPSAVLRPGEIFRTTTIFRFSTDAG